MIVPTKLCSREVKGALQQISQDFLSNGKSGEDTTWYMGCRGATCRYKGNYTFFPRHISMHTHNIRKFALFPNDAFC